MVDAPHREPGLHLESASIKPGGCEKAVPGSKFKISLSALASIYRIQDVR